MNIPSLCRRAVIVAVGVAALTASGWAAADPPSRVARLGYASGPVSFSPAGEADWVDATLNRPMGTGDRLWTDARARAEIQIGGAVVHLDAGTSVSVLNLDDRVAQLQLTEGVLNVRVRRLEPDEVFEVDTPNLAFVARQPGDYRIEVDPDGSATTIVVRRGGGEVYGEGASYAVDTRQPYRFAGTDLRDYRPVAAPRFDDFDQWAHERDRAFDSSASARYVSPDVVGYQDLDAHGTWRVDATYGNVWTPNRVSAGWAPYRDGHWAWVDPWGWTWVDDAPWGYAVSHYGRWANFGDRWGWVPGPVRTRAYYAPALVAFIGGDNFQLTISSGNVGGVAWFPLAPREVYRPSYAVSRGYFERVNQSNTVINNTVINNTYNTTNVTNIVYANRQVPGAVVAVPTTTFVQSQPVARSAVILPRESVTSRIVSVAAPLAPTEKSVHGAASPIDKPPARVLERPVVARTAPPPARIGFAAQRPLLTEKPGTPLDDAARKRLEPVATVPAPVVKLIAGPRNAPTASPPADREKASRGDRPPAGRQVEPRGRPEQRARPVDPPMPPPVPQVAPPGADDRAPKPDVPPAAPRSRQAVPAASQPGNRDKDNRDEATRDDRGRK